jgi:hypothetical protein
MTELSILNESNHSEIIRIIQYNQYIRKAVQDQTREFLILKNDLLEDLRNQQIDKSIVVQNNETFFDTAQIELLNEQVISPKLQLALVGPNACGKTSFLHFLLRAGTFLPTDVGPVTARVIRLTYTDAENAVLCVYQSLNNKQLHQQVSLKEFFFNRQEPDWDGMKTAIRDHVERPDPNNIKPDSEAFAEWAKFFVEIRMPSSFLKLGIDIYDTPGLLFSDPLVLRDNLCQLVKLVKPTLVFMYDNASVSLDARDCFLALKDSIGQLTDTSMFFLNTKADIERILSDADPNNQGIEDEKISEIIFNERQKRYQLLLKVPGMASEFPGGLPKSIVECPCFDIVSVHSDLDELGAQLNQTTINRLVQFTANSDLKIARKVSKLVLPMIDAFFDLALTTIHQTTQQFRMLLNEALQWTENYYLRYRNLIEQLLIELYNNILEQLHDEVDNIAVRASRYESIALIENYIKTAVQQDIIKIQIENIKQKYRDIRFLDELTDPSLLSIAQRNEFLIAAQRSSNWLFESQAKTFDKKSTREIFAEQTILAQILLITDILIESNDTGQRTGSLSNYKQLFNRRSSLRKDINTLDIAKERLKEISSWLVSQKTFINEIIDTGYYVEKTGLIRKIYQFYHLAIQSLEQREKLYKFVNKYSQDFASIQCKIIAVLNLAKFNGEIPVINESQSLDENVYLGKWIDENEFIVKKTLDYLEVHYHLKVTQLRIPNIFPLLNLYEDKKTKYFWMFFPKYSQKLKDTNLTIDNLFEISYDIANTLTHLHLNEIVHGNVTVENILLDINNQCYLGNFHFKNQHELRISSDIYAFGQLGKYLYERIIESNNSISEEDLENLNDFKILFTKCLSSDVNKRPKAIVIAQEIKEIRKKL